MRAFSFKHQRRYCGHNPNTGELKVICLHHSGSHIKSYRLTKTGCRSRETHVPHAAMEAKIRWMLERKRRSRYRLKTMVPSYDNFMLVASSCRSMGSCAFLIKLLFTTNAPLTGINCNTMMSSFQTSSSIVLFIWSRRYKNTLNADKHYDLSYVYVIIP